MFYSSRLYLVLRLTTVNKKSWNYWILNIKLITEKLVGIKLHFFSLTSFDANAPELRECWDISGIEKCDEKTYPMAEIPEFKHAFDDIRSDLENMAKKILRCIEIFMNLEEKFLISKHKSLGDSTKKRHTELRSLYYSALNRKEKIPANATRFGEHQDFGTITFVMQDEVGGLEVMKTNSCIKFRVTLRLGVRSKLQKANGLKLYRSKMPFLWTVDYFWSIGQADIFTLL